MRKISILAMTAATACLCLMGCKGKSDNNAAGADAQDATAAGQEQVQEGTADAQDVSGELADLYMLCPFMLQVDGQINSDGEPVTVERKWICGSSVGSNTVADWVLYTLDPSFPFNVDGWHFVGRDIVNAAETYKIVDEDAWMSLSSYCTIRTEKYVKPEHAEAYQHVTFSRLYSVDEPAFEAPNLKTQGNRHNYKAEALEYVQDPDLQDRAITSFYLQEWVSVMLPAQLADQDVTLAVVRYQYAYDNVTFDADRLSECLWNGKPELDQETGNATASFYVNDSEPVGFYDLLFIANQKVQHRLTLLMTQEPAPEQ